MRSNGQKLPVDKIVNTEVLKHLKNQHRVDMVGTLEKMMYRWGFYNYTELNQELNRLTYRNFVNEQDSKQK